MKKLENFEKLIGHTYHGRTFLKKVLKVFFSMGWTYMGSRLKSIVFVLLDLSVRDVLNEIAHRESADNDFL